MTGVQTCALPICEYAARQLQVAPDGSAYIMLDAADGTWADLKLTAEDLATLARAAIVRSPGIGLVLNIAS